MRPVLGSFSTEPPFRDLLKCLYCWSPEWITFSPGSEAPSARCSLTAGRISTSTAACCRVKELGLGRAEPEIGLDSKAGIDKRERLAHIIKTSAPEGPF